MAVAALIFAYRTNCPDLKLDRIDDGPDYYARRFASCTLRAVGYSRQGTSVHLGVNIKIICESLPTSFTLDPTEKWISPLLWNIHIARQSEVQDVA